MNRDHVRFCEENDRIEILDLGDEATIGGLVGGLEAFRLAGSLRTSRCAGCGECCTQPIPVLAQDMRALSAAGLLRVSYPSRPDPSLYEEAVRTLMRDADLNTEDARGIYEYNNSTPIILERRSDGSCVFLESGYCSIYERRPLACRIYLCCMGSRLEILEEQIVSSGTWHAYAEIGWLDGVALAPNPFNKVTDYLDVRIADFDAPSVDSMEKLFFYF